jgi:S-adenosylmethionine hydrolase
MTKRFYVRVIGDYGDLGDMAFSEVSDRLDAQLDGIVGAEFQTRLTSVPAFDTVATGFVLAQLAINSPLGDKHLFYVNTAPRKDKIDARTNNEGEGLVYAKLTNGVQIVAVNSGYSLTLIKPFATEIRRLDVSNAGSQFRSRDIFPIAMGAVARGDSAVLAEDFKDAVPDHFPENAVVYTDGYGNLKTSVTPETLVSLKGQRVTVEINGREQVAIVGTGIFDVADGEYCFAKGSSGWALPNGQRMEFSEVIKRGGNAAKSFGTPPGGIKVSWRD